MTPNKKSKKKKAKKRNRKSQVGKRSAAKRTKKKAQAATPKKTRRGGKKRRKATKSAAPKAARKTTRKGGSKKRKGSKGRKTSRKSARRALSTLKNFVKNGRRFSANQFMASLKEHLKTGAVIVVGFVAHKALMNAADAHVASKIGFLNSPSVAPYRKLISGIVAAIVGLPLLAKIAPSVVGKVGGGMVTSLLHTAILTALGQANQPKIAGYFAGLGEYFPVRGFGAYELQPGGSGTAQAIAGLGYTQAMAGPILQAQAGTGAFMATNLRAVGEYFPTSGMGEPLGYVHEGIMVGDQNAAERALNIVEAQAGVGDVATEDLTIPELASQALAPSQFPSDIPGGNDGVFNPWSSWAAPAAAITGPEPTGAGVLFGEQGIFG